MWENEMHDGSTQKRNCRHWAGQLDFQLWGFPTVKTQSEFHKIHHFYPFVDRRLGASTEDEKLGALIGG